MMQGIEDPRLRLAFDRLPHYVRAWKRWGDHPDAARTLIFLGVKLTDADHFRGCLARVDVKQLGIPEQCSFARDLDAFVFVTYGVLDAFSQIVAEVAEVQTTREIKFPLLARILAEDSRQAARWDRFRNWIEWVYRLPWYIELRRLRNVINYGSVLGAPVNWPPQAHCVSQWLANDDRVMETVEQGLALLLNLDIQTPGSRRSRKLETAETLDMVK
jgi:hypothetical protein